MGPLSSDDKRLNLALSCTVTMAFILAFEGLPVGQVRHEKLVFKVHEQAEQCGNLPLFGFLPPYRALYLIASIRVACYGVIGLASGIPAGRPRCLQYDESNITVGTSVFKLSFYSL